MSIFVIRMYDLYSRLPTGGVIEEVYPLLERLFCGLPEREYAFFSALAVNRNTHRSLKADIAHADHSRWKDSVHRERR